MGQGIGLDLDGVGLADELGVGEHGAVDEADIGQTHPFREDNTRSVVAFSVLLASKLGVKLDYELFACHAAYVRNALVWCTQGDLFHLRLSGAHLFRCSRPSGQPA